MTIDDIFCSYAKTAKKVDMKRLKVVAWSILSQASNEVRIALEVDFYTWIDRVALWLLIISSENYVSISYFLISGEGEQERVPREAGGQGEGGGSGGDAVLNTLQNSQTTE